MNGARGNAVPETALTVSFTLLVLFGIVQLATTAFYQVSADGASFVAAHDTVAAYGSPTNANQANAASSASGAFTRILGTSVSVLNPNGNTFETDVAQQVPGISALGNAGALTIGSRLIEASAGTASPSPAYDCVQGGLSILSTANSSVLSSKPVGLVEGSTLLGTAVNSGVSTLSLNTAPLTARVATLASLSTDIKSTAVSLSIVGTTLNALPLIKPSLSQDLVGPVSDALSGTFVASNELVTIDNELLGQVPLVGSILANTINPILTGGLGGGGLLGPSGPLAALNNDEKALSVIDASATTSC